MQDINKQIEHRMGLLLKTHNELEAEDQKQTMDIQRINREAKKELNEIKKEIGEYKELVDKIYNIVFQIGHQLRQKVPKQQLENLQKKVDEWNVDQFITRKELEKTFRKHQPSSQPQERPLPVEDVSSKEN